MVEQIWITETELPAVGGNNAHFNGSFTINDSNKVIYLGFKRKILANLEQELMIQTVTIKKFWEISLLEELEIIGSKEIRANPISITSETGKAILVQSKLNNDFLDEVEMFPDGAHVEMVDATSGAFIVLIAHAKLGGGTIPRLGM